MSIGTAAGPQIQAPQSRRALAFDLAERVFIVLLMSWFVSRFLPTIGEHPYNALLVAMEVLTALFVIFRRPGQSLNTGYAWAIALVGTCAPLLVAPTGAEWLPAQIAGALMMTGLVLSFAAKIFLNRSFGIVAANRGVKRGGPYRLVRHPMYAGYLLTHLGFLSSATSLQNVAIYAACWTAMILRIRAEEAVLSQDPAYRDYQDHVRSRLIPGIW